MSSVEPDAGVSIFYLISSAITWNLFSKKLYWTVFTDKKSIFPPEGGGHRATTRAGRPVSLQKKGKIDSYIRAHKSYFYPSTLPLKKAFIHDSVPAVVNWIGILGSWDTPRWQGVVLLPGTAAGRVVRTAIIFRLVSTWYVYIKWKA